MKIHPDLRMIAILCALCMLFFIIGNNILNLTDPDEVFYVGTVKEMVEKGTWSVPYLFGQPQFEKPIVTYWLIRVAFALLGFSSFAARLFPALFALVGVLATYYLCLRAHGDRKRAFLSAVVLMAGGLYIGLARTVFTDMIFSIFILLALAGFYLGYQDRRWKTWGLLSFFVFSGLAVLTKGLLGIVFPFAVVLVFLAFQKELKFVACWTSLWGMVLLSLVAVPWYAAMINQFGDTFIQEFYYNDHIRRIFEAEHKRNDTWYFYPAGTVLSFFPWTVFVTAALGRMFLKMKNRNLSSFELFLACWTLVPFIILQPAHSKLVSYIFPVFPALAILTGDFIREGLKARARSSVVLVNITWGLFLLLPVVGLVALAHDKNPSEHPPLALYVSLAAFVLVICSQILSCRKNAARFPYAVLISMAFFLAVIFGNGPYFEKYLSSRHAIEKLPDPRYIDGPVLCSKNFLRSVRFYTGKDVVFMNMRGGRHFSPHPVPFLDTADKVDQFLKSRRITYGILDGTTLVDLERVANGHFVIQRLGVYGSDTVVMIRRLDS